MKPEQEKKNDKAAELGQEKLTELHEGGSYQGYPTGRSSSTAYPQNTQPAEIEDSEAKDSQERRETD